MKRYTIGLITGILLTGSAFMFMGQSSSKTALPEVGTYQATTNMEIHKDYKGVYVTTINTKTGNVVSREKYVLDSYKLAVR